MKRVLVVLALVLAYAGTAQAAILVHYPGFDGPANFGTTVSYGGQTVYCGPYYIGTSVNLVNGAQGSTNTTYNYNLTCISAVNDIYNPESWQANAYFGDAALFSGAGYPLTGGDQTLVITQEKLWKAQFLNEYVKAGATTGTGFGDWTVSGTDINFTPNSPKTDWGKIHSAIWDIMSDVASSNTYVALANTKYADSTYSWTTEGKAKDLASFSVLLPVVGSQSRGGTVQPFLVSAGSYGTHTDTPVPEPATWALLLMGASFAMKSRRRRQPEA